MNKTSIHLDRQLDPEQVADLVKQLSNAASPLEQAFACELAAATSLGLTRSIYQNPKATHLWRATTDRCKRRLWMKLQKS